MIAPDDAPGTSAVPSEPAPPIVRGQYGGYSVARMCACGRVLRSGKDAVGLWKCTACGRPSR